MALLQLLKWGRNKRTSTPKVEDTVKIRQVAIESPDEVVCDQAENNKTRMSG